MSAFDDHDLFREARGGPRSDSAVEAKIRSQLRRRHDDPMPRAWLGGDPVASAWWTALSATFPRGEAFFIETIRKFREGTPERLNTEIRTFIQQEARHSQEHIAFNRLAEQSGYDLSGIDRRMEALIDQRRASKDIVNLATTVALEHFTAMIGSALLGNAAHMKGARLEDAALFLWHSEEEVDHKGVAYDTWLHATRSWSAWKRWKLRSLIMLYVTVLFFPSRIRDTLELLEQQGLSGWRTRAKLAFFLLVKPGLLTRMLPRWFGFFLPGFHPWNHDDRHLLNGNATITPSRPELR